MVNELWGYDAIIIGAGLAGLAAGLRLQQDGHRVLILERRSVAGGLCGTRMINGYEFVIGCNDFGMSLELELRSLRVPIRFKHVKTRLCFDNQTYQVPLSCRTLLHLVQYSGDIVRFVRTLRNPSIWEKYGYFGALVNDRIKDQAFADILNSLAYAQGVAPADLPLEELKANFSREYAYGYDRPIIPEGGPGLLVQKMVKRFTTLGGTLILNTECTGVTSNGTLKVVSTREGRKHHSRQVISSVGRWECYPLDAKPGLCVGMFHVAVRKNLTFPKGVHTLAWFPPQVDHWLAQLDAGGLPVELGFHLFASDLPPQPDYYSINLYFFLPRAMDEPSTEQLQHIETYLFDRTERLLPGFLNSVIYKYFVSPRQYVEIHGLSSRAVQIIPKAGFTKPDSYDPERDIYYIGNSVQPRGDHAGGAVLSGLRAAKAVARKLYT
jgi:phytoene dehydrogenase-like protein